MRLFQNIGLYLSYRRHFDRRHGTAQGFTARRNAFLADRFGAPHLLFPVLKNDPAAFFTNGDDEILQRAWARENGMRAGSSLADILIAQIEQHRSDVFYNLDPMRYGSDFIRRLPGSIRHTLAWRAAPSPGADFGAYGQVLCNFPGILESYRQRGWNAAHFAPAHDPVMDAYAQRDERPVDILFVGGYSRHHLRRAKILEQVAALAPRRLIRYHLDCSRLMRLAESPLGWLAPIGRYRRPRVIRDVSSDPVFGLELYEAISRSKVVLNCAVDMAGEDRGNMRCFEAMGCGAAMVSDRGKYPAGMVDGGNFIAYDDPEDAAARIERLLDDDDRRVKMAQSGLQLMHEDYSKSAQWQAFQKLVGAL
jgi:hypothetical protein